MESDFQQRNVNFVTELSSRAHFKYNFMLIKNWIGTRFSKIARCCFMPHLVHIITPPCKRETRNFWGLVPIQFLISIKLYLKWALDESSLTQITFLLPLAILDFGPWRQMCTGYRTAHRVFFMSRVPLTQFRLFWAESSIFLWWCHHEYSCPLYHPNIGSSAKKEYLCY